MRIVGGTLGGRKLVMPGTSAASIRPTSDRARESVFNMLASVQPMEGITVLDLFAGTGALGIEALSRGAAHATFVDADPVACHTVTSNLEALDIAERAAVVRSDVLRFLAGHSSPADLAFADPPYIFDRWRDLLDDVMAAVLVCESDREIAPGIHTGWQTHRVRRYGTPVITILTRRAADGG
ncbi:MAG: 16S rRNA (guanine(966)-N(2))-methyltransferase RsmD [Acidimicrobiaceae bacterium]|nr:16S rRNA (guanine(966)-N(2))-methyltransferase RsmD [Acidimicrobiaceae bacterium]MDE0321011.1 16S rRNA (guanine(966)-N(2))-methyltransferase RsmD [Acidimicrobiaceae bacterium]